MNRYLLLIIFAYCGIILFAINSSTEKTVSTNEVQEEKQDGPGQFIEFHKAIRTPEDATTPEYKPGFILRELTQAKSFAARKRSNAKTQSNGVLEWKERGPANVPGRTRGIIVDPGDVTKNTWYVGSAGGGVWKTTNGGQAWTLLTPDLPNLATTTLAMADSNPNIIYVGTGESFGGLVGIRGNGMFKSTDRGQTWQYLTCTESLSDINRIAVSPTNANVLVVATTTGIHRSTDGGTTWTQQAVLSFVEDLRATPGNFNIQYAARNGVGIYKSVDAGITWSLSNEGMSPAGRVEIAVSPVNVNRVFASAEGTLNGSESDLYISSDAGATWSLVNTTFNNTSLDFLGGQGWYDNTLMCDPFNANVVYHAGVSVFRTTISNGSSTVNSYNLQEDNTTFLTLTNFSAPYANGRLDAGTAANASVEVRFGAGRSQKAHRFEVPVGATSGVPDANYSYTGDYVEVPFEVWDVTNNRQLMVSFRDQDRNGQFNLLLNNTTGSATEQSREYIFISNVDYNATTPSPNIAVNGGHIFQEMYFFWPVLAAESTWPASITTSKLIINLSSATKLNATTITVADAYNEFDGKNQFNTFGFDVHPDHHNLVPIIMSGNTYRILNANDGGLFISNTSATPGIANGNWSMVGNTYNTSQFYGADKRPGSDEYFGGMQDNGTWRSPTGQQANQNTNYLFSLGGDGFEVIWHKLDPLKLIGGSQYNGFSKSINGGFSWTDATSGLSGNHPFISKLATSNDAPDVLYTLSSAGVFRSNNFGSSWTLTPITDKWSGSSLMDVEVSRANANIIWAGSGMNNTGSLRNLHVSTNGGQTFTATNNYTETTLGGITKLASHPTQPNTAYALFSFAGRPKILRTTNLGQSWQDITGFGLANSSSNGFPDVAVFCVYVRPDNPDIIWAGTEIGIVESLDNGATWALLDDFPNVSVWDLKGVDNQVVIATHGRGIWTAEIETSQLILNNPVLYAVGTSPKSELALGITLALAFDSTHLYVQGAKIGKLAAIGSGNFTVRINGIAKGVVEAKVISFKGGAPYHSNPVSGDNLQMNATREQYFNYFQNGGDLKMNSFSIQTFGTANSSLQSFHNYLNSTDHAAILKQPIIISEDNPFFYYRDVALVEPGETGSVFGQPAFKDYVVVEATKDGINWTPIADGYNASFNNDWLAAFNAAQVGNRAMLTDHNINLNNTLEAGDTVLFRFRLSSNATVNGWGWAIDDLYIQQAPTATEPTTAKTDVSVYPNPTTGKVKVRYSITSSTDVTVVVHDLSGRVVTQQSLGQKTPGSYENELLISDKPGQYLLQVQTKLKTEVVKVLVVN